MATSMAFCKDGSPVQALLAALRRLLVCSCGLPVQVDNDERLYLNMCLHLFCVLRNCSAMLTYNYCLSMQQKYFIP